MPGNEEYTKLNPEAVTLLEEDTDSVAQNTCLFQLSTWTLLETLTLRLALYKGTALIRQLTVSETAQRLNKKFRKVELQ